MAGLPLWKLRRLRRLGITPPPEPAPQPSSPVAEHAASAGELRAIEQTARDRDSDAA